MVDTEVNLRIAIFETAAATNCGNNKLCLTGLEINLKTPIGDRRVTDEHGGTQMRVEFHSASAPPTSIVGTAADVKGREAFATVTGWLVLSPDDARLCDTLSTKGDSCKSGSIKVDFSYAPQRRPTGLTTHGNVQVSNSVVTLTGVLEDRDALRRREAMTPTR